MACDAQELKQVPLFALLDDEEAAVLASQVEMKKFVARERIYKIGDTDGHPYVMVSGKVLVTIVDKDQPEVVVDEPIIAILAVLLAYSGLSLFMGKSSWDR